MTDSDRKARDAMARAYLERVATKFLALYADENAGSFTVHFKRGTLKSTEWRVLDDNSQWPTATGTEG